jgi:hypothetical protein
MAYQIAKSSYLTLYLLVRSIYTNIFVIVLILFDMLLHVLQSLKQKYSQNSLKLSLNQTKANFLLKPSQTEFKPNQTDINGLYRFQFWFGKFGPETEQFGFRFGKKWPKPNQTKLPQHYSASRHFPTS